MSGHSGGKSAITPSSRCGRCSPGRRRTVSSSATRPPGSRSARPPPPCCSRCCPSRWPGPRGGRLARRLAVALAAVHAARPGAIRALQLDDADLGNQRITIAGGSHPLDDLTRQLLLAWLEHRRRRWPNPANPHLIINMNTALETGPVSSWWIERELRGQTATLDRLRIDRQLEEALVHGPDPLHLAEVFGMDEKTAIRYADSARALLERSIEADLAAHLRGPAG